MAISKKTAKALAVRYEAYLNSGDDNGLIVWGRLLLAAQEKAGIELATPALVLSRINYAEEREREKAQADSAQFTLSLV